MEGFIDVLSSSHFWMLMIAYYLIVAIIGGMPEPMPNGSRGYQWFYNSAHLFAGNLQHLANSKLGKMGTKNPPPDPPKAKGKSA